VNISIDLHLHTTVSDGRSTPDELVAEAAAAGLSTIAVTDHDTTGACAQVAAAAHARGMSWIPGIEITAVHEGRDVHMLAYFFDTAGVELSEFLERQRVDRRRRLFVMADVLERIGVPIDREPLNAAAANSTGRSPGRPLLADGLIRAGHVKNIAEAFERYLGDGRPAFISREGASPVEVVALIKRAGGITSIAHPGKLRRDDLIPVLAAAGMDAIEVNHPDHDDLATARYAHLARQYSLLVTGGSDYHGKGSGRTSGLGRIGLGAEDYSRLIERSGWAGARP